jgi:hypothetical protein
MFIDPEDGCNVPPKFGWLSTDYRALYPRKEHSYAVFIVLIGLEMSIIQRTLLLPKLYLPNSHSISDILGILPLSKYQVR